ncbi:MAG: ABC transporter permease [Pontiellaceae bacterium]|nr:ABC transporter permease [Pontiellaceae bacterium]
MKALLYFPIRLVLMVIQNIWVALGQIWSNKVRSMLTTLGIIIGIASVSGVIGSLSGLKAKIITDFESFGLNSIYISARQPDSGPLKHASPELIKFKPEEFDDLLAHCPSVKQMTRMASYNAPVSRGERSIESATITCVDAAWVKIESRDVLQGRPFSLIDETQGRRVCLIDEKTRDKLNLDKECVGSLISIDNFNYRIVGLIEGAPDRSFANMGRGETFEVIIPFWSYYQEAKPWFNVIAASKTPELAADAQSEITFYLRRTRNQRPGDPDTFRVDTVGGELEQFDKIMGTITAVAGGIVGVSLLVGGIGIMNIMLVSVAERTREIGLRKAVGAKGSDILMQFLTESVVLCFVGGIVGIGLGYLITLAIRQIPNANLDQAYIPGWAIMMSLAFSAGVGIFFGVFPAFKAARLNPIEALRNE